jgi:beta-lactamase class C
MKILRNIAVSALALGAALPAIAGDIDTKEVDRRAQELMKRRGMVGMAIAVIDDGEITFSKGYGQTTTGSDGQIVTEDTVFRWASLSKAVAAATALSVAEDGHFSLPTPVEEIATHIDLPGEKNPVTLEHVLSHQVGLTRNAFDPVIESNKSRTHIKAQLSAAKTICAPGSCHSYQNAAFDLSADMIEAAMGVPYRAVVNARIFEPLGMETASLSLEGLTSTANWAKPHNSSGHAYRAVKPTYYRVPGAAGVNSSVTDLAKWVLANMDEDGEVISVAAQGAMQTARTRTQRRQRQVSRKYPFLRNAQYGLGWRLYDYEGKGGERHRVVAHRGAVQGYRASLMFDPVSQDGVVMLWNSNSSRPNGLTYEVMDQSFGKTRTDWLRLNPTPKPPQAPTILVAKAAPAPSLSVIQKVEAPVSEPEVVQLTAADIEKIIAEEDAKLMAEALAATCPCPDDVSLSGSGE